MKRIWNEYRFWSEISVRRARDRAPHRLFFVSAAAASVLPCCYDLYVHRELGVYGGRGGSGAAAKWIDAAPRDKRNDCRRTGATVDGVRGEEGRGGVEATKRPGPAGVRRVHVYGIRTRERGKKKEKKKYK